MVEELDGLCVEGKVPQVLVTEEVYGVGVELERERLEEGHVISKHLFIREIQPQDNDGVHVIVRQEIICVDKLGVKIGF